MTQINDTAMQDDKNSKLKRSALKDLSDFGIVILAVIALSCLGYGIDIYKHKDDNKPKVIQKGHNDTQVKDAQMQENLQRQRKF